MRVGGDDAFHLVTEEVEWLEMASAEKRGERNTDLGGYSLTRQRTKVKSGVYCGLIFTCEAQTYIPKERLSRVGDPTVFGTRSRGAGELGVEGKDQHHDYGLAHGIGVFSITRSVLHF